MARIEVKPNDHIYVDEKYDVGSHNSCMTIGQVVLDYEDNVWIFNADESEDKQRYFYQEELEQILYVVDKLNKRDKLGKYNKKQFNMPVVNMNNTKDVVAKPLPF